MYTLYNSYKGLVKSNSVHARGYSPAAVAGAEIGEVGGIEDIAPAAALAVADVMAREPERAQEHGQAPHRLHRPPAGPAGQGPQEVRRRHALAALGPDRLERVDEPRRRAALALGITGGGQVVRSGQELRGPLA